MSSEGVLIDVGYRNDRRIDQLVLVENKTVERILPNHLAELLTYLKLAGMSLVDYYLGRSSSWRSWRFVLPVAGEGGKLALIWGAAPPKQRPGAEGQRLSAHRAAQPLGFSPA